MALIWHLLVEMVLGIAAPRMLLPSPPSPHEEGGGGDTDSVKAAQAWTPLPFVDGAAAKGTTMRWSSGPGRRIITSAGARSSSQTRSSPERPWAPVAPAETMTRSKLLLGEQAGEGVAVGAAALDPGVDRDAFGDGALFDRLQHRHRLLGLARDRAVERQALRHRGEVGGHQRRALGPRQAERRVDRAPRDLGAGEGQQDVVDGVGFGGGLAAAAELGEVEAADQPEHQRDRGRGTCSITTLAARGWRRCERRRRVASRASGAAAEVRAGAPGPSPAATRRP